MSRALLTIVAIVLVALGIVASSALFTVYETQQALVFQFGDPKQVIRQPGLHVKVPFVQDVVFIDKRILPLDSQPEEIIASDQRRLVVDAFLRFRVVDPLKLYQTTTTVAGARTRLGPLLNSSLRQVLGREPSNAIVSGERSQVMTEIQQLLNREAERFGIEVVDVRIKRADFPDEVSQTIFRRNLRQFASNRLAMASVGIVVVAIVASFANFNDTVTANWCGRRVIGSSIRLRRHIGGHRQSAPDPRKANQHVELYK